MAILEERDEDVRGSDIKFTNHVILWGWQSCFVICDLVERGHLILVISGHYCRGAYS